MLKDGMTIEATHVKKKQLHHYLPPELVQRKKKVKKKSLFIEKKLKFLVSKKAKLYPICIPSLFWAEFGRNKPELKWWRVKALLSGR